MKNVAPPLLLKDLVRSPKGTSSTYLLTAEEESYFRKRISTYSKRSGAVIATRISITIFLDDETVQRMAWCKVERSGKKRKKRGVKGGKKRL